MEQQLLQVILHEPVSSTINLITESPSRKRRDHSRNHQEIEPKRIKMSNTSGELCIKWSVDMEKCIDASPILGVQHSTLFIGSHSGLFMGVNSDSGDILWEQRLGGRVEGTATVSLKGDRVFVGK